MCRVISVCLGGTMIKRTLVFGLVIVSCFAGTVLGEPFRAGAFVADITPRKFPVPMAGSMTPRFATQAHDPLAARGLALDDGATRIASCIIDSVAVTRDI